MIKTELELALITIGKILEDKEESLENFDSQILTDLSNVLSLEVQSRLDRSIH
tara:strand:+ start:441 stop:599 length:159 start_codon:yes stop_codon:yes gene_type:complete